MPARRRTPNEIASQAMPLLLLGMALIASNRYVTFIDSEVRSLDSAAQPVRTLVASLFSGSGNQDISPFYGIVLHYWLHWTAWNFEYLRIPAIAIFLVGLFFLARVAHRFSGAAGASAAVWLGILWPFGFHYGRLAAPYAFVFFLVAGLTFTYLRFIEENSFERWAALSLFGAALLWTNFLGWAVLGCLVIDQVLRRRAGEPTMSLVMISRTVLFWIVAFIPVMRPSFAGFKTSINVHQSFTSFFTSCWVSVYTAFVSESVAPWHWQFSVPAGIAVIACIVLVFMHVAGPERRFLMYGGVLILAMAAMGILAADHLFFAAPWILFPIAVAIGSIKSNWARPSLAVALLVVGGIGWFGIYARRYYFTPQFQESWPQVAQDAAAKIQTGATVVSNSGPFFLYLTYALRSPVSAPGPHFDGLLPESIHDSRVKSAEQWAMSDHSLAPAMIWIQGSGQREIDADMDSAAAQFDRSCGSRISRLMSRDSGFTWKQRFLPKTTQAQWLIEVREYDCTSSNSQEIFPIPAR